MPKYANEVHDLVVLIRRDHLLLFRHVVSVARVVSVPLDLALLVRVLAVLAIRRDVHDELPVLVDKHVPAGLNGLRDIQEECVVAGEGRQVLN